MIGSKVLLPVSSEAFDELLAEVTTRGQGDRRTSPTTLDLSDVVLVVDPDRRVSSGIDADLAQRMAEILARDGLSGLDVIRQPGKRSSRVTEARASVAALLRERGWTHREIGDFLFVDHKSSIYYEKRAAPRRSS